MGRQALADARDKNHPIGVFEGTARSLPAILLTATAPLTVLLTTPLIRPYRWGRLAFTYLIPVLPLRELARGLESESYSWEVGELRFPRTPVTVAYLLGTVTHRDGAALPGRDHLPPG